MSKYSIALILPLSLLTGFSFFSAENFTARQYKLDGEIEIVNSTNGDEEPVVPGQGRQGTSAEKDSV